MPGAEPAPAESGRHPVLGSDPENRTILTYLRRLVLDGHGYEYRDVLGWATLEHIQTGTTKRGRHPIWQVPEKLRSLRLRELIHRENAALSGARSAEFLYRITDRAAAALASVEGTVHVEVPNPSPDDDPRVLLRSGVADVLLGLRLAADVHEGKEGRWIDDEPEWRSSLELTAWTSAEHQRTGRNRPYFVTEDLRWAVTHGLVERRNVQDKTRDVVIYRITLAGAAIVPLEWHGPTEWGADGESDEAIAQ
jgi:hypothetical protein